ncbi:MAG: bifunctional oligoribonuclease/PAP phosphatase NrnA [Roseburia sp.]|nr:bifunctional oligoribonuclease/PAP phosphatase NrnA [Roseburia sp.]
MINLDLLLAEVSTVAISGHIKPDGDCVGSCLATYNYIKNYYPKVQVDLYLDPIPEVFLFLHGSDEIKSDRSADISYDLFIAQDCGDVERLGASQKYFDTAAHTINIDHHISNTSFGEYNYVVPEASSASELIFHLLPKERITKEIAECIYTGIVHDTGVFQYSCTSKSTMEAAGFLMDLGIDYPKIVDETFFVKTFEQNKIYGTALLKSQLHLNGTCISSVITKADMDACNVTPTELEGIASKLRSTKGVETALFVYETGENEYKISFRSAKYVDVSAIAVRHGGGGHKRAAGLTMNGTPEEIVNTLVKEVDGAMA